MLICSREPTGQLASLLFLMGIIVMVLLVAFGVDRVHLYCVKSQLQNAADSAAIAGAINLSIDSGRASDSAITVASQHTVDGKPINPGTNNCVIEVAITSASPNDPGSLEVKLKRYVSHFLMPIVGRYGDWVQVRAKAAASRIATQMPQNTCFPLAVSYDTVPAGNPDQALALSQMRIGDMFHIYIGSQKYKNAAFTSFTDQSANANYIRSAVNQILNLTVNQPGLIPSLKVGDSINLNNGVVGQKHLADGPTREALLGLGYIILPVISGNPPFNQSRTIQGFIAVKVLDVKVNKESVGVEELLVKIVKVGIDAPDTNPGSIPEIPLSVRSIKLVE